MFDRGNNIEEKPVRFTGNTIPLKSEKNAKKIPPGGAAFLNSGQMASVFGLDTVFLVKSFNTTGSINQLLLTGEKGMAGAADFNFHITDVG